MIPKRRQNQRPKTIRPPKATKISEMIVKKANACRNAIIAITGLDIRSIELIRTEAVAQNQRSIARIGHRRVKHRRDEIRSIRNLIIRMKSQAPVAKIGCRELKETIGAYFNIFILSLGGTVG